jgi:ribosomal protein L7/L12
MDSVTLVLSIYDALSVIRNGSLPTAIRDAAEQAILDALRSVPEKTERWSQCKAATANLNLTLQSVPGDHKVRAVAVIKNTIGFNLRQAKDFVESVMGKNGYLGQNRWVEGTVGAATTLVAKADLVNIAAEELRNLGCTVVVDDWGLRDPD